MNPTFVHRSRGTDHQHHGLYRFWCHLCDATPPIGWATPGAAGDMARFHLIHAHRFLALAKRTRTKHGGTP